MRRLIIGLVLATIIFSVSASTFFIIQSYKDVPAIPLTAKASDSFVFLCVNSPPTINASCNSSFNQSTRLEDNRYYCQLNTTDSDADPFIYLNISTVNDLWASVNSSGVLMVNASQNGVGNQTIIIAAQDSTGCTNGNGTYNYSFEVIDINDPPNYDYVLPNSQFASGNSISPYSLNDYFSDPDGDSLNFSVLGDSRVTVSINQVNGNVQFSSNSCGTDYLLFRATDPDGLFGSYPADPDDTFDVGTGNTLNTLSCISNE